MGAIDHAETRTTLPWVVVKEFDIDPAHHRCAWRARGRRFWRGSCRDRINVLRSCFRSCRCLYVRPEELDSVVVERIVRRRDHDTEIGAHRARQHPDCRRGNRTGEQDVHAHRRETGHQSRLDHVPGEARILADQDAMLVIAVSEDQPGGLTDFQRKLRRNHPIGPAADSVGAEITRAIQLSPTHSVRLDAPRPDVAIGQSL